MISGKILRDAIISGANNINNQRSRVDELNVFPVPDGDTGTNMGMTVGAAVRELEALDDSCTVGESAKTAASAMLRGARGNSGVITSLLFRGFSKALEGKKEADVADIVAALQKGVEGAYKAVMKPTEGTILTVARVASEEAAASDAADVPALWDVVLTAGQKALEDTPNLLPVLKKAGVVDAGGQGIMVIFEGMGKVFHGEAIIAGGEAEPMIVVMPNGNASQEAAPGETSAGLVIPTAHLPKTMDGSFEAAFPEIVAYVDGTYRTRADKSGRAIAGLSMGGFHALNISKEYPEMFDYVGLFSAAIRPERMTGSPVYENFEAKLAAQFAGHPALYYIAIGEKDFLYENNRRYRAQLDAKGYPYEYYESGDGHIWRNWRVYLSQFAKKVFR